MTASTSSAPAGRVLALPIAVGCSATAAALYVAALDPSSSGTLMGVSSLDPAVER